MDGRVDGDEDWIISSFVFAFDCKSGTASMYRVLGSNIEQQHKSKQRPTAAMLVYANHNTCHIGASIAVSARGGGSAG